MKHGDDYSSPLTPVSGPGANVRLSYPAAISSLLICSALFIGKLIICPCLFSSSVDQEIRTSSLLSHFLIDWKPPVGEMFHRSLPRQGGVRKSLNPKKLLGIPFLLSLLSVNTQFLDSFWEMLFSFPSFYCLQLIPRFLFLYWGKYLLNFSNNRRDSEDYSKSSI